MTMASEAHPHEVHELLAATAEVNLLSYPGSTKCQLDSVSEAHPGEMHEMPEAGVEVGLLSQRAHMLEVGMVHVSIDPEEPLEHGAHHLLKVVWKWQAIMLRKHLGIVHLPHNTMRSVKTVRL